MWEFLSKLLQQFGQRRTKTLAPAFVQFSSYCYYNFNPCGIFENMMSITAIFNQELEQGIERKINGSAKKTVQKTPVVMFVINWNLARYPGKTYGVRKCKKNEYRKFDHRGGEIKVKCRWYDSNSLASFS